MNRFPVRLSGPLALTLLVVVMFAGTVRAADLLPPDFRGQPLGVEGHWNASGFSSIQFYGVTTPTEYPWPDDPELLAGSSLEYLINFPNWVDNRPLKIGRIQFYWFGSTPEHTINIVGTDGDFSAHPATYTNQGPISTTDGSFGYFYDFEIRPNPDWEQFAIRFPLPNGGQLVEVDIDTISIPEPASVALLGGLALVALRRRTMA